MKKRIVGKDENSGITSYYKKQGDNIVIDNNQVEKWNKELGDNCLKKEHQAFFMSKVNSPEFAAFKTIEGRA